MSDRTYLYWSELLWFFGVEESVMFDGSLEVFPRILGNTLRLETSDHSLCYCVVFATENLSVEVEEDKRCLLTPCYIEEGAGQTFYPGEPKVLEFASHLTTIQKREVEEEEVKSVISWAFSTLPYPPKGHVSDGYLGYPMVDAHELATPRRLQTPPSQLRKMRVRDRNGGAYVCRQDAEVYGARMGVNYSGPSPELFYDCIKTNYV